MKLNIGDLVEYDNAIYQVFAIVYTTLYLRKSLRTRNIQNTYTMKQVHEKYHDIEFI